MFYAIILKRINILIIKKYFHFYTKKRLEYSKRFPF